MGPQVVRAIRRQANGNVVGRRPQPGRLAHSDRTMAVGALGRGVLAPVEDHERARGANRGVGRVGPDGELAASLIGSLSGIRTAWQRGVAATAGEEATVSPVVAVSAMSALTMILARGRFIRLADRKSVVWGERV